MKVAVIFCIFCLVLINIEVSGQRQREGRRRNDRNNEFFQGQRQGQRNVRQQRGRRGRNQNNERAQRRPNRGQRRRPPNNPPSVLRETDIVIAVCDECKRVDSTLAKCGNICPGSDKVRISSILPLGDSFCYFCENYRYNANYYRMCRNRFCA